MSDIITAPMTVTVSAEAGTFTMSRGTWSASAPLTCLPGWIRLYRQLRDRGGGRWRRFYEADVAALEKAQREAKGMQG
ncbi:hypothetical protein ORIO_12360 [Cereibacter azotoformans]|uniref:hypothetical protein n=1 Tax=Cereibacter azotoformans TaxID=43057 RepID=UPI001EEB786D|nr:hypothetical protein [Cereibacter azotoformans]ULB10696.1 hypothetical protein ORIO_12360 [Cereibacter azotoformans]